jgi:Ca2+-binding RTX toxin-like protein
MRSLLPTALATGLVAATLLTAPTAQAAADTCQGRAATVVGTPGQYVLTGTEGDDVIVTNGAGPTLGLGGNDLICVTGGTSPLLEVSVDAGAGDDVVDASAVANRVMVELGAGSDTYTGSPYDETVHGGTNGYDGGPEVDTERDTITTGSGGDDRVTSGSDRTVINTDVVVLGADDGVGFGNSLGWTGPLGAGGRLDGGGGAGLGFGVGSGDVLVDASSGTLSQDGANQLRWTGFDRYTTGGSRARTPRSFTFLGTDRDEELDFRFPNADKSLQNIIMGGGDDVLSLGHDDNVGRKGSSYAGGPGADHVNMWAGRSLDLDLRSGRMVTKKSGRTVRNRLTGFETQLVGAKKLVLEGTKKADELRFYACKATVQGRGGADDIRQSRGDDYFEAGLRCNPRKFRLFGGGGKDALRGSTGRDLLVGGPGRDTINGNAGRDTCSGEKLRSCEIKRR